MNSVLHFIRPLIVAQLVLTGFTAAAQGVSVPDPGLNAAIRETLQKTNGQLTQQDLLTLTELNASGRNVSSLEGLQAARNLTVLNLQFNEFTTLSVPSELTRLSVLDLSFNQLTSFTLPAGLTNLNFLFLDENQLTKLDLPAGLTSLTVLQLSDNQLVSLTLPPDMTNLVSLFLDGNPLTTLVLPEPLAGLNLAELATTLNSRNVSVFTYPLTPQLIAPRQVRDGSFQLAVTGPPGVYVILASTNLADWSELTALTNQLGTVRFADEARVSPQRFYRVRSF